MGIVCGFYRLNNEMLDILKSQPANSQVYLDKNYSWVNGKYHLAEDIVFLLDKAWDIAKFLLIKCDPSSDDVLNELFGSKIDINGDWDSPRYVQSEKVKEFHLIFGKISNEDLIKAYDQKEMIESHVYRADWWQFTDCDYILSHVNTIKRAFAKAAATGDNLVVHFH